MKKRKDTRKKLVYDMHVYLKANKKKYIANIVLIFTSSHKTIVKPHSSTTHSI